MAHAGTAGSSSQRQSAADWNIPVHRLLSHDVMDVCPRETALVGTAIALNTLAWQTLLVACCEAPRFCSEALEGWVR
jgi:type IV secretory pathway TrbD component